MLRKKVCRTALVILSTVTASQIRVHLFGFDSQHQVMGIHKLALFTRLDHSSSSSSFSSCDAGTRSCLSSLVVEDPRKHTITHTLLAGFL